MENFNAVVSFIREMFLALNIKASILVAGLFGGLSFQMARRPAKWYHAILSVTVAAFAAAYLTPFVISVVEKFVGIADGSGEHAISFLIGLVALNLIELLIRGSEQARDNPKKFIRDVKEGVK